MRLEVIKMSLDTAIDELLVLLRIGQISREEFVYFSERLIKEGKNEAERT